jgi:hypothetical protein
MRYLLIGLLLLAGPARAADMTVVPAIDGIFAAFQSHPLVGLGEHHSIQQELDFYSALIRDPRFAADVGNVVVEFGGAAHQDIIDRYVNGEDVSYAELRKVWTDTVGWLPVVTRVGYAAFFAQVRETNKALPPGKRIRVWLGEPVIDWSKITHAGWLALNRQRDTHAAALIEREILAKGRKALLIYGAGHFEPPVPGSAGEALEKAGWSTTYLSTLIRRRHPDALFVAIFYNGIGDKTCAREMDRSMETWPVPAMATPARGSFIANKMRDCSTLRIKDMTFPGLTDAQKQQIIDVDKDVTSQADAIVYVGPSTSLIFSPYLPDLYLDADYGRIVAHHHQVQTGEPFPTYLIQDYTRLRKVRP